MNQSITSHKPVLSPRRRRLRRTAAILSAALLVGSAVGVIAFLRARPTLYRPGETSADITSSLAREIPAGAPRPRFTDMTSDAGLGDFRTFSGARTSQLPEDMGAGAAWGDFDNDGDDDLFLVSAGGPLNVPTEALAPCALFANLGQGKFARVAAFPETKIHGMSAAWGDYDGDGYLDLAVSGYNTLILFHNEGGTGKFIPSDRFPDRKGFWAGVSWGDYDNDRQLDLYVCGYARYLGNEADRVRTSSQLGTAVPYTLNPASYEPEPNLLFHNEGGGNFTEMAESLGVSNPTGRSLSALWHDFDDDGWLDLYVANDIAGSVFYHNTGGHFEDLSGAAWVADYRSAMGLAAGDYNRDGDDDLFVSHWVAQENALFDNLWSDSKTQTDRAATNRVANAENHIAPGNPGNPSSQPATARLRFMDVNEARGLGQIALPFVGWGTEFVDLDGDGWQDLIVANGNTLEQEGPTARKLKPQEAFLFWNQQGQFFHNLSPFEPSFSQQRNRRGLALSDYDNDGDMDVLFVDLGQGVQLLRNDMQTGHWIKVRLQSLTAGGAPLGFGDGAKVVAQVGGAALRRTVSSASYLSQSSRVLHFGLGPTVGVERLEVRWLGGITNVYRNLGGNTTWLITENDPLPKRIPAAQASNLTSSGPPTPLKMDKDRLVKFWSAQRAAMDALKIEKDIPKATRWFRVALELNPDHEDSRYYLGNCLAMQGDWPGALEQLQELIRINPQSHRGHSQWGILRAMSATSNADLQAAESSLTVAYQLNPEETGALLALGEVALLRGNLADAEDRLARACRTNPKAVGGFFLRAYLAWKRDDAVAARELLAKTREALGKDWQPHGATSEGDVRQRWHSEKTPLSRFWEAWDGKLDLGSAFSALESRLSQATAHTHPPVKSPPKPQESEPGNGLAHLP